MRNSRAILWRNLARSTRGQEIAEAALVLPLLLAVLMAIFWFGQAFRIYGTLAHGTRAGAEAAVAPACTTCTASTPATNAQAAVYNSLSAAHLNKSQLVPWGGKWTAPILCACGTVSAPSSCRNPVACDGSVTDVCVQENVQLSYTSQGGMGTCGTSVSARYQYPYHFSIPLTNLDLGNVLLPGQAQMRNETQ